MQYRWEQANADWLRRLNQQVESLRDGSLAQSLKDNQIKALDVVGSEAVRRAVDLSVVEAPVRVEWVCVPGAELRMGVGDGTCPEVAP